MRNYKIKTDESAEPQETFLEETGIVMCQGIYNVEETEATTVQKRRKTTSTNGTKHVGAVTLFLRGGLVTIDLAVSAKSNSVPTFLP
ncbi:hypothetical protein AVEN_62285-1 [Araneus ventricosus]|uniref:Uncharacterized protein n=1 Tax=Araneus ventricosus TaxID=182803 RepID=A0A4Y2WK35_ARAVE|nr:hypothetical protein AVEN_62285-1 [Araneus ventricosus]